MLFLVPKKAYLVIYVFICNSYTYVYSVLSSPNCFTIFTTIMPLVPYYKKAFLF